VNAAFTTFQPRESGIHAVWPGAGGASVTKVGFRLRNRWADWDRAPFTSASQSQVAVFEKRP
jgi:hypothetical protein